MHRRSESAQPVAAAGAGLTRTLAGALVLAMTACTTPGAQPAPPLRGTAWQVLPQQAPEMSPPRPAGLRLDAATDRYSGFTGCNRITGGFELNGQRLRLQAGATTRMACTGDGDREEARFLQALPRVESWQWADGELRLLDAASQPVLRLRAAPTRP